MADVPGRKGFLSCSLSWLRFLEVIVSKFALGGHYVGQSMEPVNEVLILPRYLGILCRWSQGNPKKMGYDGEEIM